MLLVRKKINYLINNKITLSSYESCTGGAFASTITNVKNSSKIFQGSLVLYNKDTKINIGKVSKQIINIHSVYSFKCTESMVKACYQQFGSNVCVGISGILDRQNLTIKPGTVFLSILYNKKIYNLKLNVYYLTLLRFNRFFLKIIIVNKIIKLLLRIIKQK